MKKILFCALILFTLFCFSCKKEMKYLKILEEAEKVIETHPDSVSVLLSSIIYPDKLTDSEKADYGYLTALSHSKTGKAMAEDATILYTLGYYRDYHVEDKLAKTYLLAAEFYRWNDNQPMQMAMLQGGLDFSLEMNDTTMICLFYGEIGQIYYARNEYDEAIRYYHQVEKYMNDLVSYYRIGISYAFTGNVDSVDLYMNKALDLAIQQDDMNTAMHIRRNYADILYYQKKYKEVLSLQKQVMRSDNLDTKQLAASSIAWLYLEMRQPDSARIYIDSTRIIFEQLKELYPEQMKDVNDNAIRVFEAIADYAQGNQIDLHQFYRNNDVQRWKAKEQEQLIEEKINLKNRLEQQNMMLTIDRQRILLYITWAIVCLILMFGWLSFSIRRKRMRLIESEEKREVLEKMLKETVSASENNSSFFKKVLLQQLGLIKIVASSPTNHNQELLKQVSLINNKELQVDDMLAWDDLFKLIDSIYDGFYSKLTSKYGNNLTEKEKQLCCMLCAGFSTKEISVICQQGIQTIYQRKTTIRQKLKMDEKEDIVDFIIA